MSFKYLCFFIGCALFCAFLLASCDSTHSTAEEQNVAITVSEAELVGSWIRESDFFTYTYSFSDDGTYQLEGLSTNSDFEDYVVTGNWSYSDYLLTITESDEDEDSSLARTISIVDDTLILSSMLKTSGPETGMVGTWEYNEIEAATAIDNGAVIEIKEEYNFKMTVTDKSFEFTETYIETSNESGTPQSDETVYTGSGTISTESVGQTVSLLFSESTDPNIAPYVDGQTSWSIGRLVADGVVAFNFKENDLITSLYYEKETVE